MHRTITIHGRPRQTDRQTDRRTNIVAVVDVSVSKDYLGRLNSRVADVRTSAL